MQPVRDASGEFDASAAASRLAWEAAAHWALHPYEERHAGTLPCDIAY